MQLDCDCMAIKEQNQDLDPDHLAPESMHFTIMLHCLREREREQKGDGWTSYKADVIVLRKWISCISDVKTTEK